MDQIYQQSQPVTQKAFRNECLLHWSEERLREEDGRGTVVVVRVVDIVRVELDLVLVEVEVRRVVEDLIALIGEYAATRL
jgi:hypothetical protein